MVFGRHCTFRALSMGHAAPEKTHAAEGGIMRGKIEIRPVDDVKKRRGALKRETIKVLEWCLRGKHPRRRRRQGLGLNKYFPGTT